MNKIRIVFVSNAVIAIFLLVFFLLVLASRFHTRSIYQIQHADSSISAEINSINGITNNAVIKLETAFLLHGKDTSLYSKYEVESSDEKMVSDVLNERFQYDLKGTITFPPDLTEFRYEQHDIMGFWTTKNDDVNIVAYSNRNSSKLYILVQNLRDIPDSFWKAYSEQIQK